MTDRASFEQAVRATVERRGMLKGGEHVLLAVSGGADSLALLHAMHALAPALRFDLHVAHFDHGWRADSGKDADFVRAEADRLGIGCTVGTAEPGRARGRSPEEDARNKRMAFLSATARAIGATRIATGHTLDDQAETVLMRVLVGAGKRGISGIPPVRWWVIRPLIDLRRADTQEYCRALGLRPLQDPTNEDTSLLRNRIRLHALPMLREGFNRRLDEQLARMADIARDEDYYLDQQAALAAAPERVGDELSLRLDVLLAMPVPLQRRAIRLLARTLGPGIDAEHTEAVRALAAKGKTGSSLDLPGLLTARLEYGCLVVGTDDAKPLPRTPTVLTVPGETELLAWGTRMVTWVTDERPSDWPDGVQRCVVDAERVPSPLLVRRWRTGDTFRPLGMARRKKVGDFFTDARVPVRRRREVPIVSGEDGTIVWIAGHRIDDRVKVTERTRSFLWMGFEES